MEDSQKNSNQAFRTQLQLRVNFDDYNSLDNFCIFSMKHMFQTLNQSTELTWPLSTNEGEQHALKEITCQTNYNI